MDIVAIGFQLFANKSFQLSLRESISANVTS